MLPDTLIARSLTWRYLIALTLVGLLATSAWLSLHLVISEQQSTAAIVNVSGRQRMLSQRTALYSTLLAKAPPQERAAIRRQLSKAADLMLASHHGLTRGNAAMGLPPTMSETVRAMYFAAPLELDQQVESYIANLQALMQLPDDVLTPDHALVQDIVATAPNRLVEALDQMVKQYQNEGEASVNRLHKAETFVWLMTLLLLALEAAFIFRPFARQIRVIIEKLHGVTDELRRSRDELDQRVRERTADLERKHIALAESEEKLQLAASVFSNSYDGVMIADARNLIVDVNPAFTRITGYSRDEIVGQSPGMLSSQRQPPEFYRAMWQSLQTRDFWQGEIWNRRKSGEVYAERLSISVVRDKQQAIRHYIGVFTDISQIKSHEAELNQIAHYDPLTGVPNRRLLADRLSQGILHARRVGNALAVCYLDLDGFKPINDQHGHAVGDLFLIDVAKRIKQELRGEDTLARLGGDEFVIILTNVADPKELHLVLDRVLKAVNAPTQIEGLMISTTASIGVTLYPDDNADPDTLLRHADQAMYLAKDAGKNRYQLFDPEHDRRVQSHRTELQRLRTALERNEFVMHYQPKADLLSGEVVGAEALIRWQHPERGLLPPGVFLPCIEGSDLEFPLGEWVIDQVLQQIQQWSRAGIDLTVSANISADHLLQSAFVERLQQTLANYPGVAPARLELEILETVALADMEQAINVLTECRRLGIRLALDDFGTGYSSLAYFRSLPVDILKIDQSFVRHMLEDPDDLGLVESVVQLGHAFNRHVIAEGVETLAHGSLLLQLGCSLAQGYGVAKPMPAADIPAWIDAWRQQQAWRGIDPGAGNAAQTALQVAALSVRNWTAQVEAFIRNPAADLPCALDSTRSRFGRWYRGSGAARYNDLPEFRAIDPLHETLHVIATGLAALARDGQADIACAALPGLLTARDTLLAQIEALQRRVTPTKGVT